MENIARPWWWVKENIAEDLSDLFNFLGPSKSEPESKRVSLLELLPGFKLTDWVKFEPLKDYKFSFWFDAYERKEPPRDALVFNVPSCMWYKSPFDRYEKVPVHTWVTPENCVFFYRDFENEDMDLVTYTDPPIEFRNLNNIVMPDVIDGDFVERKLREIYERAYTVACDNDLECLYFYGLVQGVGYQLYPWESRISRIGYDVVKDVRSPYKDRALALIKKNWVREGFEQFLDF